MSGGEERGMGIAGETKGTGEELQRGKAGQATGATLMADFVNAHVQRGRGRLQLERVPYNMEQAIATLRRFEHIVLVNAKAPVGFFGYPGQPSIQYSPEAQLHVLSQKWQREDMTKLKAA